MPAHSFLISATQGLPACATAAEPDSSSAVNTTSPDCIPAILDSSTRSKKAYRDIAESQLRRYSRATGRYERFLKMVQSAARKCDLHLTLRCAPQFSSGSKCEELNVHPTVRTSTRRAPVSAIIAVIAS